jgi:hypothetical protein
MSLRIRAWAARGVAAVRRRAGAQQGAADRLAAVRFGRCKRTSDVDSLSIISCTVDAAPSRAFAPESYYAISARLRGWLLPRQIISSYVTRFQAETNSSVIYRRHSRGDVDDTAEVTWPCSDTWGSSGRDNDLTSRLIHS